MRTLPTIAAAVLQVAACLAQSVAPVAHVLEAAKVPIAFTHATVHVDATTVLTDATLIVKDGRVVAVGGKEVKVPGTAVVRDLQGLHIWPALLEPYSDIGLPADKREDRKEAQEGARNWSGALRADANAYELLRPDPERAKELRQQGFAMVLTHRMDGIARGTSAALALDDGPLPKSVVEPVVAAHFSFKKGSSPDAYPGSQMGAIALVRQAFLDADHYQQTKVPEQRDAVLLALGPQLRGRIVCEASDRNELLRWSAILNEFRLPGIIKGAGDEYARLDAIRASGSPLLVPIVFPEAYDVEDPYDAMEVSMARLKHWELAPHNAAMLDSAGIPFGFTTYGRKDLKDLWKDLRRMVQCGLDSAKAIEALTLGPARLFGLDDRMGALRVGMRADLLITSHHLLDEKNEIHETWVGGQRFVHSEAIAVKLNGRYDLNLGDAIWVLDVAAPKGAIEAKVRKASEPDSLRVKAKLQRDGSLVTLSFAPRDTPDQQIRLSGTIHRGGGLWDGQGQRPGGAWFAWSAIRKADKPSAAKPDSTKKETPCSKGPVLHPLMGYGWKEAPTAGTVILSHATVWTNGPQGILRNVDVCIHEGKVKAVGPELNVATLFPGKRPPKVTELNATGKHITCGIVDEHSHIAISKGVNEGTQAVTAEVRVSDVVNPDDVNIYRDLAGGVTTAQLLHGSANPIGGQSALIKMRWGQPADSMLIQDAPKHIKFALGENVKQSNWSVASKRFPQTRMGVEQVYYDAFHRAEHYATEVALWKSAKPRDRGPAPRRDLELEALVEILNGDRNITCHSYVQGEIDMLMHVADSMGFRVNTFTHILEGYKMADKMRANGVNASTFSDWWAYKFEVYDAIPYNAAIMHKAGVLTGLNSDDAEMSRRLNQEAAKTVKYGGVSEEDAWKMVTLNPARMLKLDHRIGSVEVGKDADIVVWSDNPLSIDAKVERTYVDGVPYYDAELDRAQREWITAERDRIVRAMLAAKQEGAPTRKVERDHQHLWHCDDLEEDQQHIAP
ncbi:MAG: amidohydrolase family protein [Flavobacteriales bacterium]